jgi:hypothetical protein
MDAIIIGVVLVIGVVLWMKNKRKTVKKVPVTSLDTTTGGAGNGGGTDETFIQPTDQ